jgi:hypothetical protein
MYIYMYTDIHIYTYIYSLEGVQYGDENDPHAANHGHKKSLGDGGSRPRTAPISGVIRR